MVASPSPQARIREIDEQVLLGPLANFCTKLLKIIPYKGGQPAAMVFNAAQQHVDRILDQQLERTGRVRAIVLKGRKVGISTLVAARFYRKNSILRGLKTFVLSHRADSTSILFAMTTRFWRYTPAEYRPVRGKMNRSTISFPLLESEYGTGTAGGAETGRSDTIHQFHGSEVAFWKNAADHLTGALQAVPNAPGTEVILESTANGIGGPFHEYWLKAEAGESEYVAIFVPWFWMPEYRSPVAPGFKMTPEEAEIASAYRLDAEQIMFRRNKINEMNGDEWRFKQEYPLDPEEAFQTQGEEGFIKSLNVVKARKADLPEPLEWVPRILGVDVARGGKDKTFLCDRWGRTAGRLVYKELNLNDEWKIAEHVATAIEEHEIDRCFIDTTGIGGGVHDILKNNGFGDIVRAVNFAEQASEPDRFKNRRAEIWWRTNDWLKDTAGVEIPDDNVLHRHLCGPISWYDLAANRFQLEAKEDLIERLKFSPDRADALALTFAERVNKAGVRSGRSLRRRNHDDRSWMAR